MMSAEWFAGRLRELREQTGLTQEELAERVGTTVRNISRLETGVQEATWPTVVALAKMFGVSCDAFLQEPAVLLEPQRGRPRKAKPEDTAKKPRGRPSRARPDDEPPTEQKGRKKKGDA